MPDATDGQVLHVFKTPADIIVVTVEGKTGLAFRTDRPGLYVHPRQFDAEGGPGDWVLIDQDGCVLSEVEPIWRTKETAQ